MTETPHIRIEGLPAIDALVTSLLTSVNWLQAEAKKANVDMRIYRDAHDEAVKRAENFRSEGLKYKDERDEALSELNALRMSASMQWVEFGELQRLRDELAAAQACIKQLESEREEPQKRIDALDKRRCALEVEREQYLKALKEIADPPSKDSDMCKFGWCRARAQETLRGVW